MFSFKPIKKFVLVLIASYGILLAAGHWAGLDVAYQNFIRSAGNSIFQEMWSDGLADFQEGTDPLQKGMDTVILLVNKKELGKARAENRSVNVIKVYFSTWQSGFLSTAFLLALVMASPVPPRRKLIACGVGLLLITLFVLFRLWINLLFSFDENPKLEVVDLSSFVSGLVHFLDAVFVKHIVVSFVVPLGIWILITFGKGDLNRIFSEQKKAGKQSNPA
jgi:hypothetical protein